VISKRVSQVEMEVALVCDLSAPDKLFIVATQILSEIRILDACERMRCVQRCCTRMANSCLP
jgi:hypothetical protein